jgi:toxin ParE1/3/4
MERYNVELLSSAYSDLDEIFDYIMAENPQAAGMILDKIMQSLRHLENSPHSGAPLLERSLKKFNFRMLVVDTFIFAKLMADVIGAGLVIASKPEFGYGNFDD